MNPSLAAFTALLLQQATLTGSNTAPVECKTSVLPRGQEARCQVQAHCRWELSERKAMACFEVDAPRPGGENLTCYKCETTDQNDACVFNASLSTIATCSPSQPYCVVLRENLMGSFQRLERGCRETCHSRCEVWGEDEDYDWCYNCCTHPLCNTGSSAPAILPEVNVSFLAVVFTVFEPFFRKD